MHQTALHRLGDLDSIDWNASVESLSVRPKRGGEATGPNPTDCAKPGGKIHLLQTSRASHWQVLISGANVHDFKLLEPLLDAVQPIRRPVGQPGRPRKRRPKLHADKEYDYPAKRQALRQRGITRPNPSRRWVLDADLAAAFDRIEHNRLLSHLGTFPTRDQVEQWLKAGVVEQGRFTPTEEGTPQGGVVSPVLLNVALHGMEKAAGVAYQLNGTHAGELKRDSPVLIRYADDLVALCHTKEQAEEVKARLAEWLRPRGLVFNEAKTAIVNLNDGFDFLGFTVRRFGAKLLIRPSKAALRRHRARLRDGMHSLRGANAVMVLQRLTPIVRGWAAYDRTVVSSKIFSALDRYVWQLTYKWAKHTHPKKSKHWIVNRYFGRFNKSRQDYWVFGDRSSGAYLVKHAWTKIVRHQMVKAGASPDDPALAEYWADRRRRAAPPPLDNLSLRLLQSQRGRCPRCGELLLIADHPPQSPREWEQWVRITGKALAKRAMAYQERGTSDAGSTLRLIHARCR